ncbi:hypothetical protein D3C81_1557480 [compost metagenome]
MRHGRAEQDTADRANAEAEQQSAAIEASDLAAVMHRPGAGPLPPAIDLQRGVNHLQQHVRVQLHFKEDPAIEQHHDQTDRPAPRILFDRQPHGDHPEGGGKQFKPGHGGSLGE